MRYWVSFALGLQSKVLTRPINILKKIVWFCLRSPFKAITFLFKFYFTLMLFSFCIVLLAASFSAKATTVFDRASNSVEAGLSTTCLVDGRDPQTVVDELFSEDLEITKQSVAPATLANQQTVSPNGRFYYTSSCTVYKTRKYDLLLDGNIVGSRKISKSVSGTYVQTASCSNLGTDSQGNQLYPDHTILGTTAGQKRCYTAYDLTDASTCSTSNNDVLASASSPSNVCRTLNDGSKCAMEKYSVNGAYAYTQMVEPSTCFDGPLAINPYEENNEIPPTDENNCYDIGNGVTACEADPNESCPNGVCETGCGTFDIGGGAQFVCLVGGDTIEDPILPIDTVEPIDITDPQFDTTRGTNTLLAQQGANITTLVNIGQSSREEQIKSNRTLTGMDGELKKQTGLLQGIKDKLEEGEDEQATTPAEFGEGKLYEPNDYEVKNYGTVLMSAVDEMKASPIFEAVDGFFTISLSGSCPVYSTNVPYINATITIDQFCSTTMQSIWPIVKAIILLVFSFLAFRVAVL